MYQYTNELSRNLMRGTMQEQKELYNPYKAVRKDDAIDDVGLKESVNVICRTTEPGPLRDKLLAHLTECYRWDNASEVNKLDTALPIESAEDIERTFPEEYEEYEDIEVIEVTEYSEANEPNLNLNEESIMQSENAFKVEQPLPAAAPSFAIPVPQGQIVKTQAEYEAEVAAERLEQEAIRNSLKVHSPKPLGEESNLEPEASANPQEPPKPEVSTKPEEPVDSSDTTRYTTEHTTQNTINNISTISTNGVKQMPIVNLSELINEELGSKTKGKGTVKWARFSDNVLDWIKQGATAGQIIKGLKAINATADELPSLKYMQQYVYNKRKAAKQSTNKGEA